MTRILIFLLLSMGVLTSCTKEKISNEPDFLIFGHFYGECVGEECVETYKLTCCDLSEDTRDEYAYPGFNEGNFVPLPDSQFQKVKDLLLQVPQVLLDQDSTRLGQPDAGDWGGIYVEYKKGAFHHKWYIDKNDFYLAAKYRPFRDLVEEKIQLLH